MHRPHPLKALGRRCFDVARWFATEFLPVSVGPSLSSRLNDLCRLLGLLTTAGLLLFSTHGLGGALAPEVWYAWAFDVTLAVVLGRLVKEATTWIAAKMSNAFGFEFHRRGFTLSGSAFHEVFHTDGTWRRREHGEGYAVVEWTDPLGNYKRSVEGRFEVKRGH